MFALLLSLLSFCLNTESTPYPNHTAYSDSIKRPQKKVVLDSTARYVKINRIFILGNRITHDKIILRELTLKSGDIIFSKELETILDSDRKKLFNLRLFNSVVLRTLELSQGEVDILVDVKERWFTFPSPIFDLADRNFNEWWQNYNHDFNRVNYGFRLYQFNMRGRNETLKFTAQFGYLKKFELSYRFPYIDKNQKHGLSLDFDFSEVKNLAYRTVDHKLQFIESERIMRSIGGAAVTYHFRNSFYDTHALRIEYRKNQISDTVLLLNPNYFGNDITQQQYGAITYSFTGDKRDYNAYPLKGYFFYGYATKTGLTPNDEVNKVEVSTTYSTYTNIGRNLYLSNNAVGYWSTPNQLPYYNYGALGYRKQFVRGYEVYLIEGPAYAMNKTTLKKRIFSRNYHWKAFPIEQFRHIPLSIYFKIYGDAGYVKNYDNYEFGQKFTNKLLAGYGGGFDVVGSYDLVLRFEYTFNIEGQRGFFFHIRKEF